MFKLLPFQAEDMARMTGRDLLAHEQGLGKTIIACSRLTFVRRWPAIIICPAFLKRNWYSEAKTKFNLDPYILYGETIYDREGIRQAKAIIVNYEILGSWLPFLLTLKTQYVVLDECQLISNLNSQAARHVHQLCRNVPRIAALSGTPFMNRPWELFSVLSLLWPDEFDSSWSYGTTYCEASHGFGKWKFSGAKNLKGLHEKLIDCGMIRRTKHEVLKDLPPMQRFVVPLEIDNHGEYQEAEDNLITWLGKTDLGRARRAAHAERYTKMAYLKKLAAKLKMKNVFAWIDSFLRESSGKLLIGAIHRIEEPIIPRLFHRYQKMAVQIHGGINEKGRLEAEHRFQNDPKTRVLIGQMKACGLGLNLTAASAVATVEFGWNPALHQQFDKRIDRIGQEEPTFAYYLVAENTIESRLCEIIQRKTKILDRVLDGVAVRPDSLNVLDLLVEALCRKPGSKEIGDTAGAGRH